ncbi:integrase [Paenibacillus sp. FSL P4-0081]|jgi:integrase|uniref:tyrosine-type recombinase/integrase n=1 Tax=unclassified Paenibacillus TaxID=185978 RepID=UPI0004F61833|nr:site-specific integrase [Paenibacillus sp. FSL P4-0081]AIQ29316.1 integrase [Paenibacillus sp. FSL P4-0081]
MEGSVKKDDKTNKWFYVADVGKKPNGDRNQKKKRGFKTKKEAEKALNELLNQVHSGAYVEPSKMLYKDYLKQWLEDKQTKVRASTLQTYSWLVENHIIPALGHAELAKLTPSLIQQTYTVMMKESKLGSENIQKIHTLINDSLKRAERWGLISKNPAALVDRPRADKKEIQIWDMNELNVFLRSARESRYHIAFFIAAWTGMRQGEILGLRWKDIDFGNKTLRVVQTLRHNSTELVSTTKTKASNRNIALSEKTIEALQKQRRRMLKERLHAGEVYNDHDLVVCTAVGTPLNSRNLNRAFYDLIKKAKIRRISFHSLRHTHASLMLASGENVKIVSERLGHANIRITLDTYSHLLPNMQRNAAQNFDKLMLTGYGLAEAVNQN